MNNKRKTLAVLCIALIASLVTFAIATVLYSLIVPSTWNVSVSQGLELDYSNGTIVSSISWTVSTLGTQSQSFILKNKANHAVNVTSTIPASTSLYTFTTTFVNNTIAQSGQYAFSTTLTDLGMDSSTIYSGNFGYLIVDRFPDSYDNFETSSIAYASDTNQYFSFVSEGFNSSSYALTDSVLYHFTTQNINQTYNIQGLSYKLEVLDSSNNVVSTVCDGLVVAYYQDATHYGTFGNGTHMTDMPLMPNAQMTIWNSFSAPSTSGIYHVRLTYESHNAQLIVQPIVLTWICPSTSLVWDQFNTANITSVSVSNGANPNSQANVNFVFYYASGQQKDTIALCHVTVTITQGATVISTPYSNYEIDFGQSKPVPVSMPESLAFTTPNPSVSTSYTITVTLNSFN